LFFKASFHWNNQIDLITNSIAFYGKNAELYTVAGVRAKKLNRTPDAQYFFNQAIAVNKNDSSSYMHLIHLLSEEGNREEISSFLISNQSQFTILESNILLEVSALYLNILDYGNAEKYLQLYLNLNPANDRTLSIESEIKNLKEYIKKINL
jgi:tetratricopeptide (TPR) repeat protein